jgi:hypothetical protein
VLGVNAALFGRQQSDDTNTLDIRFGTGDTLRLANFNSYLLETTQVFRDTSAWFHLVLALDTTQATANNRARMYVNGVEVTQFGTRTNPTQNADLAINSTTLHHLGATVSGGGATYYFPGYLANIHFIDGQALDPSSFTETDATTGQLIPKTYTGTYGLVSVTAATGALPVFNTTDTYGAIKGTGTRTDTNSASIVLALPMDGTNGGTSFGDQSAVIRGSGSAKTVTVTGNTNTSTTQSKFYGSSGSFDGTGDYLSLSSSADFQIWNSTSWTIECFIYINSLASSFYFFGAGNRASTTTRVMFSVNSSGNFILDWDGTSSDSTTTFTTGLSASKWYHLAVVSNGTTCKVYINGTQASTTATLGTSTQANAPISIGVPGLASNPASYNGLNGYVQDFRIYKGVAKYTSDFATVLSQNNSFNLLFADNSSNTASTLGKDTSGLSNNWTPNNFSVTAGAGNDSLVDSPTNYGTDTGVGGEVRGNYCTWNPLDTSSGTLTNGNLDLATGTASYGGTRGTISVTSGKWYWEVTPTAMTTSGELVAIGICASTVALPSYAGAGSLNYTYMNDGQKRVPGSDTNYGATFTVNDVIGVALDLDAGTLVFYKNGSSQGTAFSSLSGSFAAYASDADAAQSCTVVVNFGQRAFAYTAPSGFKALCTQNLPEGTITTSGSFTGNANANGPFVYSNGVPTAMTINSNAVTFATHADKLSNGFKLRTSSGSYNTAGSNTYSITTTGDKFKYARAQPNP